MLVGVGGSGKQSLTRLAAFSAGCEVFELTLTRGYSESDFREDLKLLYQKLGLENKKMVFLFTDSHVAEEGINKKLHLTCHRLYVILFHHNYAIIKFGNGMVLQVINLHLRRYIKLKIYEISIYETIL